MARLDTPESEEQESRGSISGGEEAEPEGNIWEAKEILREKRGKVYVSWVGQDKQGRPYPSTWEPRSHCNEALLAEWDAKQEIRKEAAERRKSGGGDKSASARVAVDSKSQKRKRESLPATSAANPSTSAGNASKKLRRQTTTGAADRRASLPETAGDADSTACSTSKRTVPKRKSLSNLRVVSDSDSDEDAITFLPGSPAPAASGATYNSRPEAAAANGASASGDKGEGKQREGMDAVQTAPARASASVIAPAVTGSSSKDARPAPALSVAPRSQQSSWNTSSLTTTQLPQRDGLIPAGPTAGANGGRAADVSARPTAPINGTKSSVIKEPVVALVSQRRLAPSAPAPLASTSQRRPSSDSQVKPSSTESARPSSIQQPVAQSARPRAAIPISSDSVVPRKAGHGSHTRPFDEEEAMVEDALDSVKAPTGLSASQPAVGTLKPRKLSVPSLSSTDVRSSNSWSAIGSSAAGVSVMRPRLTDQAKPVRSETDSDTEDIDDQEVVALPHPSGETDESVRRQRRSYSPANKRYLEAAAYNKALRVENAKLREQLTQLYDTQAEEAAQKAELEVKDTELAKERAAHAASRSLARQAEQEVDGLTKEIDLLRQKLRDSVDTEAFLREQYNTASEAARDRSMQNMALESDIQRLKKQLSVGVAQIKAFYAAQISTHDGAVDTLRTQVDLLQQQHQRTGDGIRDQAARVPSLEREVGLLCRTIADLRDSLAEAQEDRDLAESKVEELEDQARELGGGRRQVQTAYGPESDSDDSDAEYRPPGSTPAPAGPSQSARVTTDSSDEDSPLSQLVQRTVSGILAGLDADLESPPSPDATARTGALPPFTSSSPSSSGSPAPTVIEMPSTVETAGQYHAAPSTASLAPLADLHPSPNSVFGSQHGHLAPLDEGGVFPAGTISLQGLERGFRSQ